MMVICRRLRKRRPRRLLSYSTRCKRTSGPSRSEAASIWISSRPSREGNESLGAIAARIQALPTKGTRVLCDYLTMIGFLIKEGGATH